MDDIRLSGGGAVARPDPSIFRFTTADYAPGDRLDAWREMKPHLVNVLTLAKELIINHPRAFAFVEDDRAAMDHRIAIVFPNYLVKVIARFPLQHARLRLIPDHKRHARIDRVLFQPVDLHGGMISS